jgi:Cu2+-exporting ATPase
MEHHGHHGSHVDAAERIEPRHGVAGRAGHDRHAGHSVDMFRDKFWLSLVLTIPVVLLSHDIQQWFGYEVPPVPGIEYVPAILGTIVFVYGGLVFVRGAQRELADRTPGMMTLISLAIIVAFLTSWAGTLGVFDVEIWWELATLITIMLLGHWLEMRSIAQARGALTALAELLPDTAERVTDGGTEDVSIDALREHDIVLVRPGARVPADGVVVDGSADVDESMITGESRPVAKERDDRVIAGTLAAGGSLRVMVTAVGEATALSGKRPRPLPRGRRASPIGRRPSSSTSRWWPARSRSSAGGCSATPKGRSSARRRCSSSPAPMRSGWRSRSSSRSRRRSERGTGC